MKLYCQRRNLYIKYIKIIYSKSLNCKTYFFKWFICLFLRASLTTVMFLETMLMSLGYHVFRRCYRRGIWNLWYLYLCFNVLMALENRLTFCCLTPLLVVLSERAESLSLKLDNESSTSSNEDPNDEWISFGDTSVASYTPPLSSLW